MVKVNSTISEVFGVATPFPHRGQTRTSHRLGFLGLQEIHSIYKKTHHGITGVMAFSEAMLERKKWRIVL